MSDADNGGLRYNTGKPMMHLIPPDALLELAKVYTRACTPMEGYPEGKYPKRNWERGMNWSKVTDSLERHLITFKKGEDIDAETGLLHTAQIAWNAMALLTYQLRNIGVDDRHKIKPIPYGKEILNTWARLSKEQVKAFGMEAIDAHKSGNYHVAVDAGHPDGDHTATAHVEVRNGCLHVSSVEVQPPPAAPPVKIEVGLRFKLNKGSIDIWEIINDHGKGNFSARLVAPVDSGIHTQMMTTRAIGEIIVQPAKATHRCIHCPEDATPDNEMCPTCYSNYTL